MPETFQIGMWTLAQDTTASTAAPAPEPKQVVVGMPGANGSSGAATATEAQPVGPSSSGKAAPPPSGMGFMLPVIAIMAVFLIMSIMRQRKEDKKRRELLGSIKKLDKVVLSSGIIGQVIELTDDEAVLRLEEGRVRVARSAIQGVIGSQAKASAIAEPKNESAPAKTA